MLSTPTRYISLTHLIDPVTMATILDSTLHCSLVCKGDRACRYKRAAPTASAIGHYKLVSGGIFTDNTWDFPGDDALKSLLHDDPDQVTAGQLSSIRRLMFDAQKFSAAEVKHVLAGSEAAKKAELLPAERAQRIQDQREKLSGMEWTGPYECSHASYDYVAKMIQNNGFTTRSSEVSREKPGRELVSA